MSSPTRIDLMEQAVRRWNELMCDIESTLDDLHDTVGLNPEAPLPTAIFALAGGYREALDAAYHIGGWLDWWWLECRLGDNPMGARLQGETSDRTIETIDDLVKLLRDEAEQEAT